MLKVAIGNDHAGTDMKNKIVLFLKKELNCQVIDCGTNDYQQTDYPLYGFKVASLIKEKKVNCGIVICGTGIGIANSVNRFQDIYCMLAEHPLIIEKACNLFSVNVLAMAAKINNDGMMHQIVEKFIKFYLNKI
jgi:ribose 5-phosphate isomerase B